MLLRFLTDSLTVDLMGSKENLVLHANFSYTGYKSIQAMAPWRSGYCYLNKGECDLNELKDDSFVKWVAKNNN